MAKKKGSSRTTITIPADLKKRMDKFSDPVNWSALACRAFEQRLSEPSRKKRLQENEMSKVIERLQESKRVHYGEAFELGRGQGSDWAKEDAQVPELQQLERIYDDFFETDSNCAYSIDELLYFHMFPADDGDRTAARDFWECYELDRMDCPDKFVQGFANGAIDVWNEVKDHI